MYIIRKVCRKSSSSTLVAFIYGRDVPAQWLGVNVHLRPQTARSKLGLINGYHQRYRTSPPHRWRFNQVGGPSTNIQLARCFNFVESQLAPKYCLSRFVLCCLVSELLILMKFWNGHRQPAAIYSKSLIIFVGAEKKMDNELSGHFD